MNRFFVGCALLGLLINVAGCESKTKTERKETVTSPTGSTTTTDTHTVESKGDNPPANERGETAK